MNFLENVYDNIENWKIVKASRMGKTIRTENSKDCTEAPFKSLFLVRA